MTVRSRRPGQFKIVQCVLQKGDTPLDWDESVYERFDNERIIGYVFRTLKDKFNAKSMILSLYTIDKPRQKDEVSLDELKEAFQTWLLKLTTNEKSYYWRNPPLDMWLETKENWMNKLCHRWSKQFNKEFDDILSHCYMGVIRAYNKGYIGSLNYVQRSMMNEILMDIRYMRNQLDDKVTNLSLDTVVPDSNTHDEIRYSETFGEDDKRYTDYDYEKVVEAMRKKLSAKFSDREIDQIIQAEGRSISLPHNLYRRLINWRSKNKKEDFECLK